MPPDLNFLAHVIQQAVASVFLLTGVGGLLGVLSNRLSRIVDRFRVLDDLDSPRKTFYAAEISLLRRRARRAHWAITLCTVCAFLVCLMVVTLFISAKFALNSSTVIEAMLGLIAGLACFLREIALWTGMIEGDSPK